MSQAPTFSITLAGDTMLGRLVNQYLTSTQNFEHVWGDLLPELRAADLLLLNLEGCITDRSDPQDQWPNKVFHFRLSPENVQVLLTAGVDGVSLANNHILDYQVPGLKDTLDTLEQIDIACAGAGMNLQEAAQPALFAIEKPRQSQFIVGLLSASDHPSEWAATPDRPGILYVDIDKGPNDTWDLLLDQITILQSQVDIVIVFVHWGSNWQQRVSNTTRQFARTLIDAGATIVAGTSPHHVQPMEYYNGKGLIFYSLGDFVDDYAVDQYFRNDLACLAKIVFSLDQENKVQLQGWEITPTKIENMQVNYAKNPKDQQFVYEKMGLLD